MEWLKKQHRALWRFYRETFGEALLMTTAAFLIICLLGFGVSLLNKSIPEFVVAYFSQMVQDGNIVTDDGTIHFWALLGNNLRASVISVLYGFIPFIYLTALSVGMNALILGVLAAYYVGSGTSLLILFCRYSAPWHLRVAGPADCLRAGPAAVPQDHPIRPQEHQGHDEAAAVQYRPLLCDACSAAAGRRRRGRDLHNPRYSGAFHVILPAPRR